MLLQIDTNFPITYVIFTTNHGNRSFALKQQFARMVDEEYAYVEHDIVFKL